ncbi:MAG: polymer-forming cytoskeletal protein [Gemmatimonadales bacterium]
MMAKGWLVAVASLLVATPFALRSQVAPQGQVLSQAVAERSAVAFFNRPSTTRVVGALTVDREARYNGDVAVLEGPVVVEGAIEGTLVALNADVEIRSGARIRGDVIVFGGRLVDEVGSDVRGSLRRYSRSVNVRLTDDRLELLEPARPERRVRPRRYYTRSYASVVLSPGETYNRVEGLPIKLGAKFEWRSPTVLTELKGYGIFRTARKFDSDSNGVGYGVDASVRVGRTAGVTIGGRFYDVVVPTQRWPLELNEVGWATLLWHRDYRDYFVQRGVSGFVTIEPVRRLRLTGELARVEESSIEDSDAWTLFRNSDPWRPNPAVDAGDYTLISAAAEFDSRPSRRSVRSGVLLRFRWERGLGEGVEQQQLPASIRDPLPTDSYTFDKGLADIRVYQRVGRDGQLRLRGMWSGTLAGDPLPIQRRLSLGGPDPLNGYGFGVLGCDEALGETANVGLCDHVLLFQAEYRGTLSFDWVDDAFDHRAVRRSQPEQVLWGWHDGFWFDEPVIVLMSNAGTGWLKGEDVGSLSFDLGAGIEFGSVGLYLAKALKDDEPLRVTLRIERRF